MRTTQRDEARKVQRPSGSRARICKGSSPPPQRPLTPVRCGSPHPHATRRVATRQSGRRRRRSQPYPWQHTRGLPRRNGGRAGRASQWGGAQWLHDARHAARATTGKVPPQTATVPSPSAQQTTLGIRCGMKTLTRGRSGECQGIDITRERAAVGLGERTAAGRSGHGRQREGRGTAGSGGVGNGRQRGMSRRKPSQLQQRRKREGQSRAGLSFHPTNPRHTPHDTSPCTVSRRCAGGIAQGAIPSHTRSSVVGPMPIPRSSLSSGRFRPRTSHGRRGRGPGGE